MALFESASNADAASSKTAASFNNISRMAKDTSYIDHAKWKAQP